MENPKVREHTIDRQSPTGTSIHIGTRDIVEYINKSETSTGPIHIPTETEAELTVHFNLNEVLDRIMLDRFDWYVAMELVPRNQCAAIRIDKFETDGLTLMSVGKDWNKGSHFMSGIENPGWSFVWEMIVTLSSYSKPPELVNLELYVKIYPCESFQIIIHKKESEFSGTLRPPFWDGVTDFIHTYHTLITTARSYKELNETGKIMYSFEYINLGVKIDMLPRNTMLYVGDAPIFYSGMDTPDPFLDTDDRRHLVLFYTPFYRWAESPPPFTGFVIRYSDHNESFLPQYDPYYGWNCSVPHWSDFKQHLLCNLVTECDWGEDEAECPYTDLDTCGSGALAAAGSCFRFYRQDDALSWYDAKTLCEQKKGSLPTLNTPQKWREVRALLRHRDFERLYVGLIGSELLTQFLYRRVYKWVDGSVAYYLKTHGSFVDESSCASLRSYRNPRDMLDMINCREKLFAQVLCEFGHSNQAPPKQLQRQEYNSATFPYVQFYETSEVKYAVCGKGHVTHEYLSCDAASDCWPSDHVHCQSLPPPFQCTDGLRSLPYTLVCDHRHDCQDGSDERFCSFPACPQRTCLNKQCILDIKWCDGFSDCVDDSDEQSCPPAKGSPSTGSHPPPALVELDGRGYFTLHHVAGKTDTANTTSCPETHFACPNIDYYCLPVYVICNDVYDCPGREDEFSCENHSCPGLYRCRNSHSCLHNESVCDGVKHCPQGDDELTCGKVCPLGCTCFGWEFYCSRSFQTSAYPDLRFLSAVHTYTTLEDFKNNSMIVHLSITYSNITRIDRNLPFQNLLHLDLSDNEIANISNDDIRNMNQIRTINLARNPLQNLFEKTFRTFEHLHTLDLSGVFMATLAAKNISYFPALRNLNLSNSGLSEVFGDGFQSFRSMRVLDLRGCPLTNFPRGLFRGLKQLSVVYADNYKLCCPVLLPDNFNTVNCHAPSDEVSSCGALLQSMFYRVLVCAFAIWILVGNTTSFVYRVFVQFSKKQSSFGVFVTHLSVSDFCMGMYAAIIGVVDSLYRGNYLWNDLDWRSSRACSAAGFLSLVSSEVSALIICLITLDRFLVTRFPLRRDLHLTARSARLLCAMTWAFGAALAAVPLLPMLSYWRFYGQTGVCATLPIIRKQFPGYLYSFSLLIVMNAVFCVLTAAGQLSIFVSIRANTMTASNTPDKSKDLTIARRLITVAMSDFVCWFPICVLGLLAFRGFPIPAEANIAMAIGIMPLNSAINPLLYTVNVIMERQRRSKEDRLKRLLFTLSADSRDTDPEVPEEATTEGTALAQIQVFLKTGLISRGDLLEIVRECQTKISDDSH